MYPSPHSSHFILAFAAFFLYSPHGIQFVLPNYSWEWSLSWHVVDLSGITPLKKTGSSFPGSFQTQAAPPPVLGLQAHPSSRPGWILHGSSLCRSHAGCEHMCTTALMCQANTVFLE